MSTSAESTRTIYRRYAASTFVPARPWPWFIRVVQVLVKFDMLLNNTLRIECCDIERLCLLPKGAGIIIALNHADEADFKLCLELSRRCSRPFVLMVNSEAFAEWNGMAGWALQRLGAFSVARGGNNRQAKRYAIDVVKDAAYPLVVFPEGEIHYLNEQVQSFKTGMVDIGMQAIVESYGRPDWAVYLVPVAIKYRYKTSIWKILKRRICRLERFLSRQMRTSSLKTRLNLILAETLHRKEVRHHLETGSPCLEPLNERVQRIANAILAKLEVRYKRTRDRSGTPLDHSWRLITHIKNLMLQREHYYATIEDDLATIKGVSQMGSWQPDYLGEDPSEERLSEMLLKLEREIYGVKRVHQLARRDVFVRISDPINLRTFEHAYQEDPERVRHEITEQVRAIIQAMIDD